MTHSGSGADSTFPQPVSPLSLLTSRCPLALAPRSRSGPQACVVLLEVLPDLSSFNLGGGVSDPLQVVLRTANNTRSIPAIGTIPVLLTNGTSASAPLRHAGPPQK
jgi:hypothetical protein